MHQTYRSEIFSIRGFILLWQEHNGSTVEKTPIFSMEGMHLVQGFEHVTADKWPTFLEKLPNEPIWAWCLFTMLLVLEVRYHYLMVCRFVY
jgi:hypothetical protein